MRELLGNAHLAYTIYHEADWWQQLREDLRPNSGHRTVQVAASARGRGGGVRWEFSIAEVPGIGLKMSIFDDAWVGFGAIADLFQSLAAERPASLEEVVSLLDRIGAVDETERAGASA